MLNKRKWMIKGTKRNLTGLWILPNKIIPVPQFPTACSVLCHQQNQLNKTGILKTLDSYKAHQRDTIITNIFFKCAICQQNSLQATPMISTERSS